MHVKLPGDDPYVLVGDTLATSEDRKSVSFMRSYPNRIPLGPKRLKGIDDALDGVDFEQIYGGFPDGEILNDGRATYDFSMARYLANIHDDG